MKKITEKQKLNLKHAAIQFGESLMPSDCANIITMQIKHKKLVMLPIREKARLIIEMMESGGFICSKRDALEEAFYL